MIVLEVRLHCDSGGASPPEGDSHMKRTGLLVVPLGVKNAVLVLLRVFSLRRPPARAFVVPFRVLSGKKKDRK